MKNINNFFRSVLLYVTVASLSVTTACHSPRLAQSHSIKTTVLENDLLASKNNDVNQFNSAEQLVASTADDLSDIPAAAGTNTVLSASGKEIVTGTNSSVILEKKVKKGGKLKAAATRVLLKSVLKKAEKAQKKFDIKKEKAAKAGKALDPDVRTGLLIGVLGLALIIIGAIVNVGILYTLGSIALVVGLVVILLAALDVI